MAPRDISLHKHMHFCTHFGNYNNHLPIYHTLTFYKVHNNMEILLATKVIAYNCDIDNSYSFLFCRLRIRPLDDLNARDSSTSFAVYFFLDLFRTATHHSDFHRVFLLVICLVLDFSCSLINIIKSTKLSHFLW
jgi:hypothetical protein